MRFITRLMITVILISHFVSLKADVIGKIPADFSVTPDGQISYTVPIAIPPGIADMQPEIAIIYSSQGGNGSMGIGWSVSGLSSITRCPRTLAQDGVNGIVNIDNDDRFCMDGQRLVLVSGTYGSPNSQYRTEIDSFSIITAHGGNLSDGPQWFSVETKARQIFEYGNTVDSRIKVSTKNGVITWNVNRIEDVKGNAIKYEYHDIANNFSIKSITYTHNDLQNLIGNRKITFGYETQNRPDIIEGYLYGVKTTQTKRLNSIETSLDNNLIKKYSFEYQTESLTNKSNLHKIYECDTDNNCISPTVFETTSSAVNYSTLKDTNIPYSNFKNNTIFVDMNGDNTAEILYPQDGKWHVAINDNLNCNYNEACNSWGILNTNEYATNAADDTSGNRPVAPIFLDTNKDGRIEFFIENRPEGGIGVIGKSAIQLYGNSVQYGNLVQEFELMPGFHHIVGAVDIKNDGQKEFIYPLRNSSWKWGYVKIVNGQPQYVDSDIVSWDTVGGYGHYAYSFELDVDSNGRIEIVYPNSTSGFWEAIRFDENNISSKSIGIPVIDHTKTPKVADINGDGLHDLIFDESGQIKLYISKGNGYFESAVNLSWDSNVYSKVQSIDYNSDGKTDYLYSENGTVYLYQFTGTDFVRTAINFPINDISAGIRHGDFNGDGKPDLFIATGGTWKVSQNYSAIPNKLIKITDGLNAETRINYKALNSDYDFHNYCTTEYPLFCVNSPMQMVSSYESSDGNGGFATYSYKYRHLRMHMRGRGSLGFSRVAVFDHQTDLQVVTTYDNSTGFSTGVDGNYKNLYPYAGMIKSIQTRYGGSPLGYYGTLVKGSNNEIFSYKEPVVGTYFPYISRTTEGSYELNGSGLSYEIKLLEYDDYGNNTKVEITSTDNSRQLSHGEVYTKTTENYYFSPQGDHETYKRYGRLTLTKVESTRSVQRADPVNITNTKVRYSAFEYNDDLMLSAEVIDPFEPKFRVRKAYEYDGYGIRSQTRVSGDSNNISYSNADPALGSSVVEHSFATHTTQQDYTGLNSLTPRHRTFYTINGVLHQEYNTIDARFGTKKSTTGPNGIKTEWDYDGFGRKSQERRADGGITSFTYSLCQLNCPATGAYQITTKTTGKPDVITVADKLDREVRTMTYGLNNELIIQDTKYNGIGKVQKTSQPYFSNDSIYWTEYVYDDLGRVTEERIDRTNFATEVNTIVYDRLETIRTNAKFQKAKEIRNIRGKIIRVMDDVNNFNDYYYDVADNLQVTEDAHKNQTIVNYDLANRKTSMNDPDMGVWYYKHDALGRLRWQKDAKNQESTIYYDQLGRKTSLTSNDEQNNWYFDKDKNGLTSTASIGKLLQSENSHQTKIFKFNSYGQPTETITTIDSVDYSQKTIYDTVAGYSRKTSTKYPNGFSIDYHYKTNGFLHRVTNSDTNEQYWQVTDMNARGQMTIENLGENGAITTSRGYSSDTGMLENITSYAGGSQFQINEYNFDVLNNLENRKDHLNGSLTEQFTYDTLNRLKTSQLDICELKEYGYDAIGNLIKKPDVSVNNFVYGNDNGKIDGSRIRPHAVTQADGVYYNYDANGNMESGDGRTISYNSFNKPSQISKGSTTNQYIYDTDRNRIKKISTNDSDVKTTIYLGKSYKKIILPSSVIEEKYYVSLGSSTVVYTKRSNNTEQTRFLLKDHLGSTDTIVSKVSGVFQIVEKQSFGAWGERRNANWSSMPAFGYAISSNITKRGFTGHEMDDEIGLINMNARLYDAKLGRFLTPDTFVQMPYSTQGLNRYTYVNNNPLSLTDPSGHFFKPLMKKFNKFMKRYGKLVMAAIVTYVTAGAASNFFISYFSSVMTTASIGTISTVAAMATGATMGFVNGIIMTGSIRGALQGALIGGITGGLLDNIGAAAKSLGKFGTSVAHGVVGGIRSAATGGKFSNGFLSGAFGKMVTFGTRGLDMADQTRFLVATATGGISSKLGGGKFANGAVTASFGYLLNETGVNSKIRSKEGRDAESITNKFKSAYSSMKNYFKQHLRVGKIVSLDIKGIGGFTVDLGSAKLSDATEGGYSSNGYIQGFSEGRTKASLSTLVGSISQTGITSDNGGTWSHSPVEVQKGGILTLIERKPFNAINISIGVGIVYEDTFSIGNN